MLDDQKDRVLKESCLRILLSCFVIIHYKRLGLCHTTVHIILLSKLTYKLHYTFCRPWCIFQGAIQTGRERSQFTVTRT